MHDYYQEREATIIYDDGFDAYAHGFHADMGYPIRHIGPLFGRPAFQQQPRQHAQPPPPGVVNDRATGCTSSGGDYDVLSKSRDADQAAAANFVLPAADEAARIADKAVFSQADVGESPAAEALTSDNFS